MGLRKGLLALPWGPAGPGNSCCEAPRPACDLRPEAYPVNVGSLAADPHKKIAPTMMLYAEVSRVTARKAFGRASVAENSPAAEAHISVFMINRPRMNMRSPSS